MEFVASMLDFDVSLNSLGFIMVLLVKIRHCPVDSDCNISFGREWMYIQIIRPLDHFLCICYIF